MTDADPSPEVGATPARDDRGDGQTLDRLAMAFAALNEAVGYAYSEAAAMSAAWRVLEPLDRDDLLAVASVLAGFTAVKLQPRDSLLGDIGQWSELVTLELQLRGRRA